SAISRRAVSRSDDIPIRLCERGSLGLVERSEPWSSPDLSRRTPTCTWFSEILKEGQNPDQFRLHVSYRLPSPERQHGALLRRTGLLVRRPYVRVSACMRA
ncbi:hypothetical protein LSH36_118g07072, partial [Paralvinella palmiformis]